MPRGFGCIASLSILLLAGTLIVPGCSNHRSPRSYLDVESVNANAPLNSDVYNNGPDGQVGGGDDFIPVEDVPIVVRNQPADPGLDVHANGPFGAVVLNHYEVRLHGATDLPTTSGDMHLRVPAGSTATVSITVIPGSYKTVPPLSDLDGGGELDYNAEIILTGKEEDSGDAVSVTAWLSVHVANWGDK